MEAIHTIATKKKKGNFIIELPNISNTEEIEVTVVFKQEKKKKFDLTKYAGKLEGKTDWLLYQKKIRSEWKY